MPAPSRIACASWWSPESRAWTDARNASQISDRPSKAGAVSQNSSRFCCSWASVSRTSLFHFGRRCFSGLLCPTAPPIVTGTHTHARTAVTVGFSLPHHFHPRTSVGSWHRFIQPRCQMPATRFIQPRWPSCHRTNSAKAVKGTQSTIIHWPHPSSVHQVYTPCFIKSGPLCTLAITFYLVNQFQ